MPNASLQTYDFVAKMQEHWGKFDKMQLGVWEAIELLNEVVDDSDPDTALPQIEHLLQTAEACKKAFPEVRFARRCTCSDVISMRRLWLSASRSKVMQAVTNQACASCFLDASRIHCSLIGTSAWCTHVVIISLLLLPCRMTGCTW
jgi:hypothetical protein